MKSLLFFLVSVSVFGQNKKLIIDLQSDVQNQEIIVRKGSYDIEVKTAEGIEILEFKVNRAAETYDQLVLKTESNDSIAPKDTDSINLNLDVHPLEFRSNTVYTFLIKLNKDGVVENRKYVFKTQSTWDWSSTFGINAIFLINSDTYKTVEDGNEFKVMGDSGQKIIEYVPSVMFSFLDRSKNISWGGSAGLGFDLEQISVFAGFSMAVGQNFIVTTGVAFHNQERLHSKYAANGTVISALSFDDLHEKYYRFNPFVSFSFRLNKSPFKSAGN